MNLFLLSNLYKYKQILKYLLAGGTAASTDIILLFIFTDIFKIWYLISAILAFIFAFFISFYLQKFWTFRDGSKDKIYRQLSFYFFTATANLVLNTALMYLFVDIFGVWYLLSQVIIGGLIGCESFLIYKFLIFNSQPRKSQVNAKKDNIKILIATGIFPPDIGGPATYSSFLKKEFEQAGCEVKIITYSDLKIESSEKDILYVNRRKNIVSRYFKYFLLVKELSKQTDIVYILDLMSAGLPATVAAKLNGKKVIFRTGGDFLWEKAFQNTWTDLPLSKYYGSPKNTTEKILIRFCRWLLTNIDIVIFSTKLQADLYQIYYQVPTVKIKIVSNAIPEIKETDIDQQYKNDIIFAGRLIKLKNIDRLVKVFSQITDKNVKLRIYGQGPEMDNLKKLINDLKQNQRIKILESIGHNELIEVIKSCLFVILPSVTEISPNIVNECTSLARPIIITKETGLKEELTGKLITIDPLSADDMKMKIEKLLDPKYLADYTEELKHFYIAKRPWHDVANDHLNIFKSIINE